MAAVVTGIKELDARLKSLDEKVQRKLGKRAVSAALRVLAKSIKAQVPPSNKSVRKAINSRFSKTKGGANRGLTEAKVGAGVGKQKKPEGRGKRPGVGISGNNVHWWILGTQERQTKAGHLTGAMPAIGLNIVKDGFKAGEAEAESKIIQNLREGIEREAKRA